MWRVFRGRKNKKIILALRRIWEFEKCRKFIKKKKYDHIEINYLETLVKPEESFSKVTKFMNLDFEPEMLNYHNFNHSHLNKRGNIKTREFNGIVDKSRDEMITFRMILNSFLTRILLRNLF